MRQRLNRLQPRRYQFFQNGVMFFHDHGLYDVVVDLQVVMYQHVTEAHDFQQFLVLMGGADHRGFLAHQ